MGRLFVVDTENTNDYSFISEYELEEDDELVLFLSDNMKSIKCDGCIELLNTKAKVLTEKVEVGEKNLLDFQLVVFITERSLRGEYEKIYIVSNNHGYRQVINYIKERYGVEINLIEIKVETQEKESKSTNAEPVNEGMGISDLKKEIIKVIPEATNKQVKEVNELRNKEKSLGAFHNNLVKIFGDKGRVLYKSIKPLVKKTIA